MLGPFKRSLDRRFDSERKRIWGRRRKKRTQKNKKVLGGPNSVRRKKLLMRIKKKGRSCCQRPLADPKAIMWECTLNDLPMAGPMDVDVRSIGTSKAWRGPEEKKERKDPSQKNSSARNKRLRVVRSAWGVESRRCRAGYARAPGTGLYYVWGNCSATYALQWTAQGNVRLPL